MIKLTRQRRVDPASPRYFQVDGAWFRRPFAVHAQQLISVAPTLAEYFMEAQQIAELGGADEEVSRRLTALHARSPEHYTLLAAVIGLYWWSTEHELEARYDGDVHRYGEAVLAELDDAGWDTARVSRVGAACFAQYLEEQQQARRVQEAAEERVNFSSPSPA